MLGAAILYYITITVYTMSIYIDSKIKTDISKSLMVDYYLGQKCPNNKMLQLFRLSLILLFYKLFLSNRPKLYAISNSVETDKVAQKELDEKAEKEPSHLDLHCSSPDRKE